MATVTALATLQPIGAILTMRKKKKSALYPQISTVGIKQSTKDGFKAPPQLKESLQDRTRYNVLPSNRESMCRCHLQGHTQLRWHISTSHYIPDPIYRWSTGWSSPHLANLESERAQAAQAHKGSCFPEDKFELSATETLTSAVTQTSTQSKLHGPLTFHSVNFKGGFFRITCRTCRIPICHSYSSAFRAQPLHQQSY